MRRLANLAGFLIAVAMLGIAYYLQFAQGMNPCPLCIFQRGAVAALGLIFLVAFIHNPKAWGRFVYVALLILAAGIGIFVASRQLYIQAHPETVMACGGASLNTMIHALPPIEVIRQVLHGSGECAHVYKFLGLALPLWVLIAMIVLGVGGVAVNSRKK